MAVVLDVAAGIATTNGYFSRNSDSGHVPHLKNNQKNASCVKTASQYLLKEYVDISFENISYSVSLGFRKGKHKILNNISGKFPSGQLTAIIGSSGSGKTTLLDVLSGYRIYGFEGLVYINNELRDATSFKKLSCYITHGNFLHPFLTIWESMKIAADLKLGFSIKPEKKDVIILDILSTLHLDKSLDTAVSELSGGEQKRLSIALELIDNPIIMFFDEPTTGLDSLSCSQCIKLLKKLAEKGKTIICTIHQPSAAIIQHFDQIYILGGGQCLYQGTAQNLVYFLGTINLSCPLYHNPVDYVVELTSGKYKGQYISIMMEAIQNGRNFEWVEEHKPKKLEKTQVANNKKAVQDIHPQRAQKFDQFKILLHREYLKFIRDAKLTYMRLVVNVLSGLLYGILYWQTGTHGGKVRTNYSLLFCILIHHMMSTMMLTILTFPREMPILTKEYFNRWYCLKMYFSASTLCDIPLLVLCCLLFTAIVYPMTGQPLEIHRIAMFTTISVSLVLTVQSVGLIIGSMFNVVNGTFIGFSLSLTMMLFAGLGEDLPVNIHWLSYLSYMKYGFEGIIGAIYGLDRAPLFCPEDQYCHFKYPKEFLRHLKMSGDEFWFNIAGLCCILLVLRFLTLFVLHWKLRNAR